MGGLTRLDTSKSKNYLASSAFFDNVSVFHQPARVTVALKPGHTIPFKQTDSRILYDMCHPKFYCQPLDNITSLLGLGLAISALRSVFKRRSCATYIPIPYVL